MEKMNQKSEHLEKQPALEEILPLEQREVAFFLQEKIFSQLPPHHFFLVGGTAIALKYGHRQSIDFDFFSFPKNEAQDELLESVDRLFRKENIYQRPDIPLSQNQIHYQIQGVGVTFIPFQNNQAEHPEELYQLPLFPTEINALGFETLSIKDLAGMKAFARCKRSKMKDVVDLAEIIENGLSLREISEIAHRQFGYDFSEKEWMNLCLDITDITEYLLDEPIHYLQEKNTENYLESLRKEALKIYHANS